MTELSLGFSPCPNDTYIFYGLVSGQVGIDSLRFGEPLLEDVETLNRWALEGRLDVTKLSFHAVGHVLEDYCILQSGSALGRGCGPLLVAPRNLEAADLRRCRVAIPGRYTTAALLFRMFEPDATELIEMRFEQIMEALLNGEVDAGVIIHESRFTYQRLGLHCIQDLGQWWEETSGLPIPLGCIAARRSLGPDRISLIDSCIKTSLEFARAQPEACMDFIRRYAQETEEDVINSHIDLYVNDHSLELGPEGRRAVEEFLARGRDAGALPKLPPEAFCNQS